MIVIHCRRCMQARHVPSTSGLETGHCPGCQRDGRIEVGWLYPDDVVAIRDAETMSAEELMDDLLRAALQHFEIRVPHDDHELRGALACVWEALDEDAV